MRVDYSNRDRKDDCKWSRDSGVNVFVNCIDEIAIKIFIADKNKEFYL